MGEEQGGMMMGPGGEEGGMMMGPEGEQGGALMYLFVQALMKA